MKDGFDFGEHGGIDLKGFTFKADFEGDNFNFDGYVSSRLSIPTLLHCALHHMKKSMLMDLTHLWDSRTFGFLPLQPCRFDI